MWLLRFSVLRVHLEKVLHICNPYHFVSWYEDESSYTLQKDENGFPLAENFFVDVYVSDDNLLDVLKDFPVERLPLPQVNLHNLDVSRKVERFHINPDLLLPLSLHVRAATAFGSGEHPTTQCCLQALSHLTLPIQSVLDLGCGSGILAIACAKRWTKARIFASDIDSESVRVTRENARINRTAISAYESFGVSHPQLSSRFFDLVVANILSGPLVEMACEIKKIAKKIVILSGFQEEKRVLSVYREHGFYLQKMYCIEGWKAIVLKSVL